MRLHRTVCAGCRQATASGNSVAAILPIGGYGLVTGCAVDGGCLFSRWAATARAIRVRRKPIDGLRGRRGRGEETGGPEDRGQSVRRRELAPAPRGEGWRH